MVYNNLPYCFLLISMMVISCNHHRNISNDIIYLDCGNAENREAPKLSMLLKDIRYVALETKDTCLLNRPTNITLTDKYIVMDGGHETECFVFDKQNGKYVRTIGMRKDPGPTGYYMCTYPIYVQGDEIYLKVDRLGNQYKAFSLGNGNLLRTIDGKTEGLRWPGDYLYPLNDSTMLQYANNSYGNRKYGLQVCTWSGKILKRFPSLNNFKRNEALDYTTAYHNEMIFYRYNGQVYFHEFTSDTIFRLNEYLDVEPVYVVGKEDKIPVPELRNEMNQEEKFKKLIKFEYLMETDYHLLMMGNRWNEVAYIYDKQTGETSRLEGEKAIFVNDLDGFLPFWPIGRGRDGAENEVWALIQPDQYMKAVKATGVNPLGFDLKFDDNPVIVIGTLK